jgi:lipoate-protein ligase A
MALALRILFLSGWGSFAAHGREDVRQFLGDGKRQKKNAGRIRNCGMGLPVEWRRSIRGNKGMKRIWRFMDSGPATGSQNMMIDEQLLQAAVQGETIPVLRFYTWAPPAVSLGRFQDEETSVNRAACSRLGIDIVRRITGGRAVLHDKELTYCIVTRTDNPLFPSSVIGSYKVIAEGLLKGLRSLGVAAEMVSRSGRYAGLVGRDVREPACFSSPSWYELLVQGRKIIGSAQRRMPGAFLQHGSILIDYNAPLEAAVIPGGGSRTAVTSIREELRRPIMLDEVKKAFLAGISSVFGNAYVDADDG